MDIKSINEMIQRESAFVDTLTSEISKVIVGQKAMVDRLLIGLLCNGHILLEGVPGLAKTLTIKTLSSAISAKFQRIQFTPDLLPADLVGTMIYNQKDGKFLTRRGPIFANFILADEINRAPAKVQSALLEAMQERQVTIGEETYRLEEPFLVLATENPIEQEGTYPLPEAQLDRFFFKLVVGYSTREELSTIIDRTTRGEVIKVEKVMDGAEIRKWQQLVREVILAPHVQDYVVRLALSTHPNGPYSLPITNQYIRWGSSPRGAQTVALASKVRALLEGRYNVSFEDVRRVFLPAMRHRVLLNFEAQAEGIESDQVLLDLLEGVPEKSESEKAA